MLRKIRIALAAIFFVFITLLFLDFTGTIQAWMGWMAKIQFLPAVLALNVGVVAGLLLLTFVFGRVYCSVICPMGVMQDIISWIHGRTKKKNRFRFSWSRNMKWLRAGVLAVFVALMLAGLTSIASLIAPYSAFGRIAGNLFAPVYALGNNVLAYFAERLDSYAFYTTDVWLKSLPALVVAIVTLVVIGFLAWTGGRTWCNTICPVGTVLGYVAKFSLFKISVDAEKCSGCSLCEKQCKASCINSKEHVVDHSRCVACMDCIDVCREGAVKYRFNPSFRKESSATDKGRRAFMASSAMVLGAAALKAQNLKTDGGLAEVIGKQAPERETPICPAGSQGIRHFRQHCTACGLCISNCPNGVLRPSSSLESLMQPEMSYERGYCRAECTKCSEVCPAGAIRPVTKEEKSSISIGHAVVNLDLCVVNTDGVNCGNCARHCPAGAVRMVPKDASDASRGRIPVVNVERCIGCGACENLCPSRPLSAIHVEGNEVHREI